MVQLAGSGTLMAVWRAGGAPSQPPTGEPLCASLSTDGGGERWGRPQPLGWGTAAVASAAAPPFKPSRPIPYGVDPKLVQLHSGQLALTAGRVGLHLWLSDPAVQPRGKANLLKQLAKQAGGGWLEYAH